MHHAKGFVTSIGTVAALLFSLTALANPLNGKAVEARTVIAAKSGESTRAAIVTTAGSAFIAGDRIGEVRAGPECDEVVELGWSDLIGERIALDLPQVFSEQLSQANYTAGGGIGEGKPVEVTASVNDMALQICRGTQGKWHGAIYVQVNWQVLSPESGQAVYQTSTEGSFVLYEPRRSSAAAALRVALAVSVRNLLADGRFVALLRQQDAVGEVVATGRE